MVYPLNPYAHRWFAALLSLLLLFSVHDAGGAEGPALLLDEGAGGGVPSETPARGAVSEEGPLGTVIFVRGSEVVAEISGFVSENEYFVVQGDDFLRKGKARVVRELQGQTYLLQGVGTSLREGDRLWRETEREAAARVLRRNERELYLAFLQRFPDSEFRDRIGRELFRLRMKAEYPARPGSSIEGTVRLAETVGRNIPRDNVQIVLDRFVIAVSSEGGSYRIDGLPRLDEGVTLGLSIKDPKFQLHEEVAVSLPADTLSDVKRDLPVVVVPTVLRGQVVDEEGVPLAGAEVWTSPYSLESLTDEDGFYRIARSKKIEAGKATARDEPLFGGEYEIYARRDGFSVERVTVTAESFRVNEVPAIRLIPQNSREEALPKLALQLRSHLRVDPAAMSAAAGAGPLLNR